MPSTGAVIDALSTLQGQVVRCRSDGTWGPYWSTLTNLSGLLTTEIGLCRLNAGAIDDTSPAALDAINKCNAATAQLAGALSGTDQNAAINATHVAMLAVAGLLPPSTLPILFS